MKKELKYFTTVLFVFLYTLFVDTSAQTDNWKNYSSLSNVADFVIADGTIFAVSDGGFFSFDGNRYVVLTKSEGLNSQSLTAVEADEYGQVWLGSKEGYINILQNASGDEIHKIYDIYTSNNEQKSINSLFAAGDTVLIATDFGLSLLSAASFNFIETAMKFGDFNSKSPVLNAKKKNGKIYVCVSEGLAIEKENQSSLAVPEAWESYPFENIAPNYPTVTEIYNDTLFVGTDKGVYCLTTGNLELVGLYGEMIYDIFVANNKLYVLTEHSLYEYSAADFSEIFTANESLHKADFSDANFYFASDKGVLELNGDELLTVIPDCPEVNLYSEITVDKNGALWVATGKDPVGKGIFKFDGVTWKTFNKTNTAEINSDFFFKAYTDNDNVNYFLNWSDGFVTVKDTVFKRFSTAETGMEGIPGAPNYLVVSGAQKDTRGNLWVVNMWSGNNKPISVMTRDSVWYHFTQPVFTPGSKEWFEFLAIDQYGTKWFANVDGHEGLFYFNDNGTLDDIGDDEWGRLTSSDGLSSSSINAIVVDAYGELWVGTSFGLDIIPNPSNPRGIMEVYALRTKGITAIYVDPLNNKWVGTTDGVYYLSGDGYTVLGQYNTENSPLPGNTIKDIAFDNASGTVYFATDYGISSLKTEAVAPLQEYGELFVYPNPFEIGKHEKITIDGLAEFSQIKIFTINGKLVASSEAGNVVSPGGRVAFWDGRDLNGDFAASGVYVIVAYNDEGNQSVTSKFAVIRK